MEEPGPLPNLPGYRIKQVPDSERAYHRKQGLTYLRGYAMQAPILLLGEQAQRQAGAAAANAAPSQRPDPQEAVKHSNVEASHLPQWVTNDRKVLRWFGFFREHVTDSRAEEDMRVRRIVLHLYLEDDTLDICEPRQDDSGLLQGMLIKRHKPQKGATGCFVPTDFAVGGSFTLYARTYHIVDADGFTRAHLAEHHDSRLAEAQPYPADPVESYCAAFSRRTAGSPASLAHSSPRSTLSTSQELPAQEGGNRLSKFLENSRKVLRFFAIWDDRQHLQGDRRPYRIHLFLEDETIEVLEVHEQNSGRDPFPVFLRRAKLPKVHASVGIMPQGADKTQRIYTAPDLRLGGFVDVHGRRFWLHDCDAFTRQYYQEKLELNAEQMALIESSLLAALVRKLLVMALLVHPQKKLELSTEEMAPIVSLLAEKLGLSEEEMAPIDISPPTAPAVPARTLPPWNGFGSREDSAQNCTSLLPQQPKKDFYKLMQKHRIVLRFGCQYHETTSQRLVPADRDRKFVLSYFCGDDTMAIFEPPQRNSGISGGKYLERMKLSTVFQPPPDVDTQYTERDLAVGAVLSIHQRQFELQSADEFTLQFMENNHHHFPQADARAALAAIRDQGVGPLRQALTESGAAEIDLEGFEAALRIAGHCLIRHQVITLFRSLPRASVDKVAVDRLVDLLSTG